MGPEPMATERAETEIPVSRTVAADARRWVSDLEEDLDASEREMVVLMLSELVSNSVRHGPLDTGDHVDLRVTWTGNTIRVEVHDGGQGFDLASVYPPDRSVVPASHGHGLALVDAMATRWGVDEARPTTVWFEFDEVRFEFDEAAAG